ncbi:hypothetical protein IIM_04089 [Bacillus cereus VD107]|nr:hypothetical protein IIM_04089 [Bacillus cereus VD107]
MLVASIVSGRIHSSKKVANATAQTNKMKTTKTGIEDNKQDAKASFNEAYAKNLPDAVKEKLKKTAADKKAVNLAVVDEEASYGKGLWNVTVKEYKSESTDELIANKRDKEIAKDNPDVILFEPSFITDNGKTGNGNSVANTLRLVQALSTSAKEATIMI